MTQARRSDRRGIKDPRQGRNVVKVAPGDHAISAAPDTLLLTVLGSCVSACIRDPVAGVGGMNHFMLPESVDGRWGQAAFSLRYGNFAMEQLINGILSKGGRRERLEIKVFGGARLGPDSSEIGERNASYVEYYLKAEGLVPLVSELRGGRARRLAYVPVSGRAFMVELPPHAIPAEVRSPALPARMPTFGSVELF